MTLELWIGLISAVIALATALVKYLTAKDTTSGKKQLKRTFDASEEIHKKLETFREKYPIIKRVLVLQTTNGGGIPKKNTITRSSVLYEAVDRETTVPISQIWQDVVVDAPYRRMLINMLSLEFDTAAKFVEIYTDEMEEYASLKPVYEAAGVTYSRLYFVKMIHKHTLGFKGKAKAMLYLSIPMTQVPQDPEFEQDVLGLVQCLKKEL